MMKKQNQKIGASNSKPRVCLWNRIMIECGFTVGQPYVIYQKGSVIELTPDAHGVRKVSRVMNHGNELPVIDLKQTGSLDVSALGSVGGTVEVEFRHGKIVIKGESN